MLNRRVLLLIAVFALVLLSARCFLTGAAPEPALVPLPGTWQLDLELHGDPQKIQITPPGSSQPRTYWYLLYTVTNNTGQDIEFYPQFDLFTNTFKLYQADVKPYRAIINLLRDRYASTLPLLEPPSTITGVIRQGKDNARDSVAVFEAFDPKANHVRIFISGLSNETVTIYHPVKIDPKTQKPVPVLLRKTLMLEYQAPGDALNPQNRVMLYRGRKWIMR